MSLAEKISQLSADAPAIHRLGMPAFNFWGECLHGYKQDSAEGRGATIYPMPLNLAASFSVDLVRQVAEEVGDEVRAISNEEFQRSGKHM